MKKQTKIYNIDLHVPTWLLDGKPDDKNLSEWFRNECKSITPESLKVMKKEAPEYYRNCSYAKAKSIGEETRFHVRVDDDVMLKLQDIKEEFNVDDNKTAVLIVLLIIYIQSLSNVTSIDSEVTSDKASKEGIKKDSLPLLYNLMGNKSHPEFVATNRAAITAALTNYSDICNIKEVCLGSAAIPLSIYNLIDKDTTYHMNDMDIEKYNCIRCAMIHPYKLIMECKALAKSIENGTITFDDVKQYCKDFVASEKKDENYKTAAYYIYRCAVSVWNKGDNKRNYSSIAEEIQAFKKYFDNISSFYKRLKGLNIELSHNDLLKIVKRAKKQDLLILDTPYRNTCGYRNSVNNMDNFNQHDDLLGMLTKTEAKFIYWCRYTASSNSVVDNLEMEGYFHRIFIKASKEGKMFYEKVFYNRKSKAYEVAISNYEFEGSVLI